MFVHLHVVRTMLFDAQFLSDHYKYSLAVTLLYGNSDASFHFRAYT